MKYMRLALFLLISTAVPASVSALSLTLMIVQKDPVQDEIRSSTRFVENAIMEYFFDTGHIISNEPASTAWDDERTFQFALDNAAGGYSDYLVTVIITYKPVSADNAAGLLVSDIDSAEIKVVRMKDTAVVSDSMLKPSGAARSETDEAAGLKLFSRQIAGKAAENLK